ncbi:MAG: ATP synthase subunit I [Desulfobacteraceae bacterium]|nr:ATP synthase subunit I [Desulfobacteraceae bacterium]
MVIQQRLLKFIIRSNWTLLAAAAVICFLATPLDFATAVVIGGLIAVINFHILHRTLKRSLTPPHIDSLNKALVKYYVRFIITCAIIFILIASGYVEPPGLLIGLSIVVASIMLATAREVTKIIFFKEAV